MTDEELLQECETKQKELAENIGRMKAVLTAKEFINTADESGNPIAYVIRVIRPHAALEISDAFDQKALDEIIRAEIEKRIDSTREKLRNLNVKVPKTLWERAIIEATANEAEEEKTHTGFDREIEGEFIKAAAVDEEAHETAVSNETAEAAVEDEAQRQQEKKMEVAPVQQNKPSQDKPSSSEIISDSDLEIQYFKLDKSVKQISQDTGASISALYKRIEKIRREKDLRQKERARHSGKRSGQ